MQGYKQKLSLGIKILKEYKLRSLLLAKDYLALKRRKGLIFNEYYQYQFEKQSRVFRNTFLGKNEQRFYLDYLNPKKYYTIARNKYLTHLLLEEYGIPKATLYCYYSPEGRYCCSKRTSNDLLTTIAILQGQNISSCVIKATEDSHGKNVFAVKKITYTKDDAILTLLDGTTTDLSSILGHAALVFEEVIIQTSQLSQFNSSSVNTIRFMTCLYPNGEARAIATFIKIGRDGAFVDNAGSGGNVDAGINIVSGKLYNSIVFKGFRNIEEVDKHPDSQAQLNNTAIDNWEMICKKVCSFQQMMPLLKAIGWDIAITNDGPKVIEMNDFWDTTGQLFIGKGWREEIRSCYFDWFRYNSAHSIQYPFERQPNNLTATKLQQIIHYEFKE